VSDAGLPFAASRFTGSPRKLFLLLLAATLAFRLWLAWTMPITGDEAYFYWWGKVPDWGFYDHPPMVGWWLALLLALADAEWWLRLPAVLLPGTISLGVAWLLGGWGIRHHWLAAGAFLLLPASVWNVFITTDTPLAYFSFFSALAFLRAARDDDPRLYLLAGALLGLAFLSKYFAVLLGVAYFAHAAWRPTRKKLVGLALLAAAALPFVAINAWWNWGHCWANLMFNLYNRHESAGLSWKTPLLYAAMMLYLLTPPVFWLLWRRRARVVALARRSEMRALLCIGLAPLLLFAALSPVRVVGLHWVLSFLPFVMILLALSCEEGAFRRVTGFLAGCAALHVLGIGVIASLPLETWKETRLYDGIVLTFDSHELLRLLRPYETDYVFASDGYSNAVTLAYNARRYLPVFGEGSSHARHDDILTDFRPLEGGNILILRKSAPEPGDYAGYFREVDIRPLELRGATYHLVLGRGFNYSGYRSRVLARVREKYYAIPDWLPQGGCYFCERYFPEGGKGRAPDPGSRSGG
jgi:hypothetical protein